MEIPIEIKRTKRAKRLSGRIMYPKIVITAPIKTRDYVINEFIAKHNNWFNQELAKIKHQELNSNLIWPKDFLSVNFLPFMGEKYQCKLVIVENSKISVSLQDGIQIQLNKLYYNSEIIEKILINFYKIYMYSYCLAKIKHYQHILKLYPTGFKLMQFKSMWGQLTTTNLIKINWLLIFAPSWVIDYVIVHELAHIQYRSHGVRFWQLVAKHYPKYQEAKKYLNKYGAIIMNLTR